MTSNTPMQDLTQPAPELAAGGPAPPSPQREDPLEAQGRAFWAAQRFDSAARAIYRNLAEGQAAGPKLGTSRQSWDRALEVADQQAELQQLIKQSTESFGDARDLLGPKREQIKRLCQQFPSSADLHMTAGAMGLFLGEDGTVIEHLEVALRLGWSDWVDLRALILFVWKETSDPPGVPLCLWWLDRCEKMEDWETYEKSLRLIMRHTERPVGDVVRLRDGLATRPHNSESNPQIRRYVLVERARLAVRAGIATEALTLLESLPPGELDDPELCVALARTLIAHDDLRRAFDYLSRIPLDKTTKILLNEIAMSLEKQGDVEGAVYVLQHINRNDELTKSVGPSGDREIEAETALAMAEWQLSQGRRSGAIGQFFRALSLGVTEQSEVIDKLEALLGDESNAEPYWQRLADHCAQGGDLYRALKHYRRLERHVTYGPRVRAAMRRVLDELMAKNPDAPQLHLESGALHMLDQKHEKAIEDLRKAVVVPEIEIQVQQNLALCYYHTGQFALALDLFHTVPLNEDMLEALTAMSHQLEQSGLHREALEAARIIHTHDPTVPNIEDRVIYLTQRVNNAGNKPIPGDEKIRKILGEQASMRYRYIAKIGSGGMGIVYKVHDTELDVTVALKVLRESLTSSAKAIDRFFREARIAASLHHPNIVNIFDYRVDTEAGASYISMEYVDGPSVREIIEEKFAATLEVSVDDVLDALNYTVQLCDALNATHRQGIIHRDIKPDNIMLNSGGIIKITDFGIVHVEEATFTPTGALIGTPRYMSPEQVQGKRVDGRSDLYAAGIILYEMVVGTPPFISGDIAYQQVNIVPTRPREIVPVLPQGVDRLIMKCLEKNPEDRFESARAMRHALAEAYHSLLPQSVSPRSRLSEDLGQIH